ncbi:MAG TPA: hypothetical protein VGB85_15355 [Nannocystis sp.]
MRTPAPLAPVLLALFTACGDDAGDSTTQASATITSASATDSSASSGDVTPTTGDSGATEAQTTDVTSTTDATTDATTDTTITDTTTDATSDTTTDATTDATTDTGGLLDGLELQETFEQGVLNGWEKVERWKDVKNAGFIQEDRFSLDMRAAQNGPRLTYFGEDPVPHSSVFIVYYAPGWDAAKQATPVLLIHGADQADRAWANPGELGDYGCGQKTCPGTGLMQDLVAQGHSVFAVSFAHVHGDNFFWAEQIHNAIRIIRERTGAAKVDLIAWSKGTMPARMYTSSLTQPWSTPYQDDVRKVILIGGPNLGMDYSFRYGNALNGTVAIDYGGKNHAPLPHDELYINFQWVNRAEYGIYKSAKGDNFRGQLQSLARWDAKYPLTGVANFGLGEFTVGDSESTYVGEAKAKVKGVYARGKGIDAAIAQGSIIDDIIAAGMPAGVETYLLCGDIDLKDSSKMMTGVPNEIAGPSDAVVFIESCAAEDGIGNLAGTAILPWNHLQLGWHADAVTQMLTWLGE